MPTDPDNPSVGGEFAHVMFQYTEDAITHAGFSVDIDLWPTVQPITCSTDFP